MRLLLALFFLIICSNVRAQKYDDFQFAQKLRKENAIDSSFRIMQRIIHRTDHSTIRDRQKAQYYLFYGKLLKLKEKTDSSFWYYQKAYEIFENNKSSDSLLYTKIVLAELFRFRVDIQKAKQYIEEAEKMLLPKTPIDIRAYYYNRRAGIEAQFFSKSYAEKLSLKVIELKDSIKNKEIIVYSLNEIGYLYEKKYPDKSRIYYLQALDIADNNKLFFAKVDVLTLLSRLGDDIKLKLNYLEQAYELAVLLKNKDMIFSVSKRLFDPYYRLGDYEKAAKYLKIAYNLQDELHQSEIFANTAEIERKYNYTKAQEALKYKDIEMISQKRILILTIIIAILSISVILFFIFYTRKIRSNNKKLTTLSKENIFLLSEANHRINNNLQLIIILISDQLKELDPKAQEAIHRILSKIESIATLHRHLYQSNNNHTVNGGDYLLDVLNNFSEIFIENKIQTNFKIDKTPIPNDQAIYLGLLVTELIINSLKHAFKNQDDKLISFNFTVEESFLNFEYKDNGQQVSGKTIKPKLVNRLCRQLKIDYTICTDNGFYLYFNKII